MTEHRSEIQIRNFTISYDGVYHINFSYDGMSYTKPICLPPSVFIKMLEIEGKLSTPYINITDDPITFEKVEVTLTVFKTATNELTGFYTSELAEGWQDHGLCLIDLEDPSQVSVVTKH